MPSVTKDKKKYGNPDIPNSKERKKKRQDEELEANYRAEQDKRWSDGMLEPVWGSGGTRKLPVRYD